MDGGQNAAVARIAWGEGTAEDAVFADECRALRGRCAVPRVVGWKVNAPMGLFDDADRCLR